ncbi:bifunctional phosphoribosylaminoimidazolecarboxamide formyltransferase/IMP cyclohydrolase [Flammeovirga kamogawensis]|uniref:Bifunctional purine biosynthesis protein PurH n=1 Tax=Flammeovirga kamogawensis TaxID=373891 RepID=A0ABX8GRF6_9BACT|nr:bifunctional phosphoribosylaminoimidazolecarboxamide formyltransferase/IMP cyclohydrolase [Flammeovirga kamogawensis]MBB6463824.1 phosphoribosylaminoimidazolecarboxamide formyltransferase/IMP cyclohydrolase [Flammeovirga kamogawensis]QWG06159.1 bifunctional phosphoribosylaminoimidazolecarboxamide formyltransferase/IMP cyclohydrolase [Flammeovirga kamogawensis]TRX67990.1 bifunctional phosphoribosylaminoimidazolecarboxamide formyltransferase/IMP cyclohydrolase [Flammeovirga kamogawensis]
MKKVESALISVFYKDNLAPIVKLLQEQGVTIYSTGGTQSFIEELGAEVTAVEDLTSYPSILGGRVKTLHPKIFGGILNRGDNETDQAQIEEFDIPNIDLVIVDLYPFEETVAQDAAHQAIVEKVDIGGISLIRAAAKNYKDTLIVSSREQYDEVATILSEKNGATDLKDRMRFAAKAFDISSHYDSKIFDYFNSVVAEEEEAIPSLKVSERTAKTLRYGENPHQEGTFYGDLSEMFDQLNGKELSYNNLVDVDAAVALIDEFPAEEGAAFAILKHTNACGVALGSDIKEAYVKALACDPVSAFGGVLISNKEIDLAAAEEIHKLFCEVVIAPGFNAEALELLKGKKNRIILNRKEVKLGKVQYKSLLNGVLAQDKDLTTETWEDLKVVTEKSPSDAQTAALLFANKICKHTKSNAIVLAKDGQLFASGVGQTSRVDALNQAILKAKSFGFDLSEAVMASDAFFPFPDCVEIADKEGIKSVVQPGGSIKDQLSVDYCNENGVSMVMTGVRHFKH